MIDLVIQEDRVSYECLRQKTPLDYLLIAVVLCVGSEIVESKRQEEFEKICVHFGNKKIKISCRCGEESKEEFLRLVSSCYILKNVKFEVEVDFEIV